jgi:hypothetical protein
VVGVQLECGAGGAEPLVGPGRALLAVGGLDDHPGQPGTAGGQQRVGVGVAFQHRQVGVAELASQWRHGHELTDQVLDAPLVAGSGLGQPITGPHPAIQRRPRGIRQHQRVQPGGIDQRQPSQGVGVDAIGLGMARHHPAQVVGLGRADPVHGVPAGTEEHRDRQPRWPSRLHHHLQADPWHRPDKGGLLHLDQAG